MHLLLESKTLDLLFLLYFSTSFRVYNDIAHLEHHFDFFVFDLSWTAHHSAACFVPTYSLSIIVVSMMMICMVMRSMVVSDGKVCKGAFFGLSLFGDFIIVSNAIQHLLFERMSSSN